MDQAQSNASSIDWTSIINNTINQVPTWLAISQNQPAPVPGGQGGSLVVTRSGIGATISPGLIIAGVVAVVALVYVLRK